MAPKTSGSPIGEDRQQEVALVGVRRLYQYLVYKGEERSVEVLKENE